MQIWNKITPKIPDRDRTDLFHNRWIELSQFALSTGSFILYLVSGILIIRSKKEFVKQNKYQIHILQQTIGKSSISTLEYLGKMSNFPIHGHIHTHTHKSKQLLTKTLLCEIVEKVLWYVLLINVPLNLTDLHLDK